MPIVSVPSVSVRIHSWLSVYLSSAGTFILAPSRNKTLAVAHEGRLDDARREALVANLDFDVVACVDADRQARESDRSAKRWREAAARHLAFARRAVHLLMAAQHAAFVDQQDSDELPLRGRGERGFADEVACALHVHRPREPGLERVLGFGHVLTVEIHARLEPQRIACAEP